MRAGISPPRGEGHENFWERFTFTSDNPPLFYADSSLYAGRLTPRHYALFDLEITAWQDVHLFNAHHDSGYPLTGDDRAGSEAGGLAWNGHWDRLLPSSGRTWFPARTSQTLNSASGSF